jgi:hypothetical protein
MDTRHSGVASPQRVCSEDGSVLHLEVVQQDAAHRFLESSNAKLVPVDVASQRWERRSASWAETLPLL